MPLLGIVDEESNLVPWANVSPEELPPELVKALIGRPRSTGIHLTDLTACPVKTAKDKKFGYYLPLESVYRIVRGKAWDCLCDQHRRPNALYQRTFRRSLGGIEVSGTPDVIDLARLSIEDFKGPARQYQSVPDNYVVQLNGYRWLSATELWPKEITSLAVCSCGPAGYRRFAVPVWGLSETYDYLCLRLASLQRALDTVDRESRCTDPTCYFCKVRSVYETR